MIPGEVLIEDHLDVVVEVKRVRDAAIVFATLTHGGHRDHGSGVVCRELLLLLLHLWLVVVSCWRNLYRLIHCHGHLHDTTRQIRVQITTFFFLVW